MRRFLVMVPMVVLVLASAAPGQAKLPPDVKPVPAVFPKKQWEKYYKNAKPGDFIEYVQMGGKMPSRLEVIEVGDGFVVELQTSMASGKPSYTAFKKTFKDLGGKKAPELGQKKVSKVKVKVGDKELDGELVEMSFNGKVTKKLWYSSEVPFSHLPVRSESGTGKVTREVVKFGKGK